MSAPFTVACTHCSAKLKLKDRSKVGKKVRCPKCSEPFVIRAPKQQKPAEEDDGGFYDDSADEWGDEFGDDWDDSFDYNPSPKKTKKKSSKSKKSGKKKKGGRRKTDDSSIPLPMIFAMIGGGVLFITLITGVVFFVIPSLKGNPADRMQWLPNNTKVYFEVHIADIWKSQVFKPIRTSDFGAEVVKKLKEEGDLTVEQVEKIVVGMPSDHSQPTLILYTTESINPNQLGEGITTSSYAGKTLYEKASENFAGFLLNDKTFVMGPKAEIQAAIDRKGVCSAAEQFTFLPTRGDIIFGTLSPGDALKNSPAAMMTQSAVDPTKMKTVAGILKLNSNLDIEIIADFSDSESAQQSLTEAQEGKTKTLETLENQQKELDSGNFVINRQAKSMVLKMKEILESVEVSQNGSTLTTELRITGSTLEDFVDMFGGSNGPGFMPPIGGGLGNPF